MINFNLHCLAANLSYRFGFPYQNSGPGNVSGIYVHERFANDTELPRFAGWWGHNEDERFLMKKGFQAIEEKLLVFDHA